MFVTVSFKQYPWNRLILIKVLLLDKRATFLNRQAAVFDETRTFKLPPQSRVKSYLTVTSHDINF